MAIAPSIELYGIPYQTLDNVPLFGLPPGHIGHLDRPSIPCAFLQSRVNRVKDELLTLKTRSSSCIPLCDQGGRSQNSGRPSACPDLNPSRHAEGWSEQI